MGLINLQNNYLFNNSFSEFVPVKPTEQFDIQSKQIFPIAAANTIKPFWSKLFNSQTETIDPLDNNFTFYRSSIAEKKKSLVEIKEFSYFVKREIAKLDCKSLQLELVNLEKNNQQLTQKSPQDYHSPTVISEWTQKVNDHQARFKQLIHQLSEVSPNWIKQALQTRQTEALLEAPSIYLDDKMFAHIHGDQFIEDSGFEGNYQGSVTKYRTAVLNSKLQTILHHPLCNNESKLRFCRELFSSRDPTLTLDKHIDLSVYETLSKKMPVALELYHQLHAAPTKFQQSLSKQLDELSNDDFIFFPGGWTKHAIAFQVIKQTTELLTFRIYNTGSLINKYHPKFVSETKTLYLPFVEIVNIPKEKFLNLVNVRALQDLATWFPYNPPLVDTELYETIINQLGGEISPRTYSQNEAMEAQRSGTCSYMSQVALFSKLFPDKISSKRFEFEIRLKSLVDYFNLNRRNFSKDNSALLLIKNGASFFSAELESLNKEGIVSDFELPLITQKLKQIEEGIKNAEVAYQQELIKKFPLFSPQRQLDTLTFSTLTIQPESPLTIQETEAPKIAPYQAIDVSSWVPRLETLRSDLENFRERIHDLNTHNHFVNAQLAITSIIKKIPLNIEWKGIEPQEVQEILRNLSEISKEYIWSFLQNTQIDSERKAELKPHEFLAQLKLLTIADKLLNIYGAKLNCPIPSLYQKSFDHFLMRDAFMFQIKDPQWGTEFNQLREYWRPKFLDYNSKAVEKPKTFFGYEQYPAGFLSNGESDYKPVIFSTFGFSRRHGDDRWEDFEWVNAWIKNPENKAKINQWYPELADTNDVFQTLYAITEEMKVPPEYKVKDKNEKIDLLPPAFFYARDLSFVTDFFLSGSLSERPSSDPLDFNKGIRYSVLNWKNTGLTATEIEFQLSHSIFGLKSQNRNDKNPQFRTEWLSNFSGNKAYSNSLDFHFSNTQNKFEDDYLFSCLAQELFTFRSESSDPKVYSRRRLSPNEIVSDLPDNIYFKHYLSRRTRMPSITEMRSYLTLSSIEELQIQETLGYYQRNLNLLMQPDHQLMFKLLMFENGLLEKELDKNPLDAAKFGHVLANFCKSKYTFYINVGNIKTAAFFLEVNHYFQESLKAYGYLVPFIDTREELKVILSKPELSNDLKSLLYRNLARTYLFQETFTSEELAELLSAIIKSKMFQNPKGVIEKEAKIEFRDILYNKQTEIKRLLSSPAKDQILNAAYHEIRGDKSVLMKWKAEPHFPRFVTEQGNITIDVLKGNIFVKNGQPRSLPDEIKTDVHFQKIFKNEKNIFAFSINENAYQFKSSSGISYQIITFPEKKPIIQREFHGIWYRYFPAETANIEPRALSDYYNHWHGNQEILITDESKPLYRIENKRKWLFLNEKIIHRLDESGNDTNQVVMNILNTTTPFKVLERFEDPSYIIVLQDAATGEPQKLELPRFGLTFDISNGKATCRELPEFVLSEKQGVPELVEVSNYLVLERAGKKIAILPRQKFQEEKNSFTIAPNLDREIPEKGRVAPLQNYLIYDIDKKLVPKTEEARLYLAKLYLWTRQYDKAFTYLEGPGTQTKAYTKEEIDQLNEINTLKNLKKDNHPQAIALRLKALAMILRNSLDFEGTPPKDLNVEYLEYLQIKELTETVRLSHEEETFIIKNLNNFPETVRNRISDLAPKTYGRLNLHFQTITSDNESQKKSNLLEVDKFLALLKHPKTTPFYPVVLPAKLLRSDLHAHFYDYYAKIRNIDRLSNLELRYLIDNVAGIDPYPDSEKKDLVDLLLNSLKLIQAGNSPEEKTAAIILETVLLHPLHFPSQLLNQENNEYEVLKFFTESIFNPVDELRKNAQPPKILQTQEASFIPLIKKQHEPKISERNIEKCVHSLTLSEPFFPNPKLYVQKKELPLENNGLLEIFNISTPDSVAKRYLESLKNKLEEFTPLLTTYKVTSFDKLNELKQNLLAAFHQSQTTLAEKQYSIELLANKLMPDPVDKALKDTRLIGHLDSPIELKEALIFFLKRDMELYHKRNPALSQEDIYALNRNIQEYLIHATHQQHIERLINQIEGLKEGDDPEDMALSLSSKREYNIADHPEYLLIEYFSKILLRKDQVESLDLLAIKDGKIGNKASFGAAMELIMGSGKTAFIGPLLSYLNADGNSLACFIMPDALLPSMASEMQTTLGNAFAQKLEVLTFSRSTKIDQNSLERLYERLSRIRDEKRLLLMNQSSVQALYLKLIEALHDYTNFSPNVSDNEILILRKIFKLFKESGIAAIDEIHIILDVLKSFHYTIGNAQHLNPLIAETITELYSYLANTPEINQIIKFSFLQNLSEHPFTESFYNSEIKERITEGILKGEFFKSHESLQRHLQALTMQEKGYLKSFLNDRHDPEAFRFIAEHLPNDIQDILSLLKEEVSVLLPLTCKKNLNEHYGESLADAKQHDLLAIPYHHGQATRNQFGTDLEIINYSIQMHMEKGISAEIIEKEVQRLQKLYRDEMEIPKDQRQGELQFQRLCGYASGLNLFSLQEEDFQQIAFHVNKNSNLQLELIKRHVLSQVMVYETQLNAEAQIIGILFKYIQGMTGTLWNYETFTKLINVIYPSNTTVKTISLLWNKSPHKVNVVPLQPIKSTHDSISAELKKIYHKGIPHGSFIDMGGIFKGISNQKVAEAMLSLECLQGFKEVAYYDEQGELMAVSKQNGEFFHYKLSKSINKKEERIAFWDQQHTSGSNILLGPQMTATVSVNRHTTLFDLLQSVYRLRGLAKGQSVNFMVNDEDFQIMKAVLEEITKEKITDELELKHVLLYTLYVQSVRQGQDNHRSFPQKMQAVLIDKIMQLVIDSEIETTALRSIFKETKELFESSHHQRPFKLYGQLRKTAPNKEVIDHEVNEFFNSQAMKAFNDNYYLKEKFDTKKIKEEIFQLAREELKNLPDILSFPEHYGRERQTQVNVQTENSKLTEVNKEIDTETDTARYRGFSERRIEPRIEIKWKREKLFEKSYFEAQDPEKFKEKVYNGSDTPVFEITAYDPNFHFDSQLLATLNQFPIHFDSVNAENRYLDVFQYQKICSEILVIEDKQTKDIKILLIDPNEAKFFKQHLIEDSKNPLPEKREVKLALYHMQNGIDVTGNERIDEAQLEANPHFQKLKAQVRILKGFSDYSEGEIKELKKWLTTLYHPLNKSNKHNPIFVDENLIKLTLLKEEINTNLNDHYYQNNRLKKLINQSLDILRKWAQLGHKHEMEKAGKEGAQLGLSLNSDPESKQYFVNKIEKYDQKIEEIEQTIETLIVDLY